MMKKDRACGKLHNLIHIMNHIKHQITKLETRKRSGYWCKIDVIVRIFLLLKIRILFQNVLLLNLELGEFKVGDIFIVINYVLNLN